MCTTIESLGIRNRKHLKTGSKLTGSKLNGSYESNQSMGDLFEHLPPSYFAPPKGVKISYAYERENKIQDEETNLIQGFLKNFTAEEQDFVKSIVKKTKNHYLASYFATLFGVSPIVFSLLYLATLFARGQAQFNPGTSNLHSNNLHSNHTWDFIFKEGPIGGDDACQDISRDTICTQFSMLKNGSIILKIISKIDTDFGFVYGTDENAVALNAAIQNLRSACIKAFNICRNSTFIERRIVSVFENFTDIQSLLGNDSCIDSGIIGGEDCQTQTVFRGLSVLGCNKILGINSTSDISVLRQCTDMVRDETRAKDLGTILAVLLGISGAGCFGTLFYQYYKCRKEAKEENQALMNFQFIIGKQFETAITLRNFDIIPDEITQLILEYSYDIPKESLNNFHQHLILKLNTFIMEKIHDATLSKPLTKMEKNNWVKAASVSSLVAYNQFKRYKDNCRIHNVSARDEVELLHLRKENEAEDSENYSGNVV